MLVYVGLFVVVATQVAHAQLEGTNSKCCFSIKTNCHIEASKLISSAIQGSGFCMIGRFKRLYLNSWY